MTPEMFENEVRQDLSRRQVVAGVFGTGISPAAMAQVSLNALFERREIQVAVLSTMDYFGKLNLTDADVEAFYKANPSLFQAPEMASVEYVVLDIDALRKGITISDDDLKTYYEQNSARLASQEERRASHILLNAPKSAPAAERQKALAKAREVLEAARKAPDSFADLARKNSQDQGSASSGGDLDFFARGAMVKPFEEAAFAMKKGEISDVVESDFGYHIIKLTDIRAPKQRSLAEMKGELIEDLKKQQAQKKFAETAEAFTNGVYEQSDNLKSTADRLKLEIRTAAGVTRIPPPGTKGVLGNTKFLNALFAPDSIDKKRNTEAIEVAVNQMVSGRIVQYTPAQTRSFADVKDVARQRLLAQRGAEMARKEGQEKLAALKASSDASASLPTPVLVSRDQTQRLPRMVIDAALRASPTNLPAIVGVDLEGQGYALLKVNKVLPREPATEATAKQELDQYAQWWTAAESLAYYNLLKDQFKTQIKVPKPAPKSQQDASLR
jgi:peptidyl-prolyl cis-trans isomerase D